MVSLPAAPVAGLGSRVSPELARTRWRRALPGAVACGDAAAATIAVGLALRFDWLVTSGALATDHASIERPDGVAAFALAPVWVAVLANHGAYDAMVLSATAEHYRRVVRSGASLVALVAVWHMLTDDHVNGLSVVVLAGVVSASTLAGRAAVQHFVRRARERRHLLRRAVLVGSRAETMAVAHHLRDSPAVGVEVVATYTTDEPPPSHRGSLADVAEQQDGVVRLISESDADVLAVAGGVPSLTLRRLTWALEGTGIEVLVAPAVADVADHRVAFRAAAGMPLLRVEGCGTRRGHRMIKNLVDRVGACGLLGVLAPLMVLAAVAVKLSSSGPVLYRQSRVGQHGRQFEFLKFRTMVRDADDRLAALAGQNASNGLLFKLHDDPRITPVGRFLRRTSIDELPQLWNAVRGDMSLVGPRPLPVYPDAFVGDERRRLRVKPGITGLWQVSGRADLSWEETVRLDLHYVDQWSLGMDLAILIRTPGAVLRGSGAY